MPTPPRAPGFDHTLALLADPYRWISRTARRLGTDAFATRLLLEPTVCLTGPDAARLFYDAERFERQGAMPGAVVKTLLGQGGVQGTDGEQHRRRKALLMGLMTPERIAEQVELARAEWRAAAQRWTARDQVVLYDEACEVLTRAACAWAGVPLAEAEVPLRTRQLTLLFDGAGAKGPRHLLSRLARKQANRWAAGIIDDVRAGRHHPGEHTAARAIADFRYGDGTPLPSETAGVALLNIVRPTVAVAVYVAQAAHALHVHADALPQGDADERAFVQEVRRWYPFFPAVAARTRVPVAWDGLEIPAGRRVMLDLFGTDRDSRSWTDPDAFHPDRFADWPGDPFTLIPQGGGDHYAHHRCAGEWTTIALVQDAIRFLRDDVRYTLPSQNLALDWSRMPSLPHSKVVLAHARPA
jgi:fatty-acid peroxygenase